MGTHLNGLTNILSNQSGNQFISAIKEDDLFTDKVSNSLRFSTEHEAKIFASILEVNSIEQLVIQPNM